MAAAPRLSRWQQLGLEWPLDPHFSRDDFLTSGSNTDALHMIEAWPQWPDTMLLLVGDAGSGKSHLAAIWAARTGAQILSGHDLATIDIATLAQCRALAIDPADDIGTAEAPLFHLLNSARLEQKSLLLTARRRPDHWQLKTPDLLSRLRLAPVVEIGVPDDPLLRAVLHKLFRDRQLLVDPGVVDFIALRIDRSLDIARAFVATLDRLSLERGAAITRAMARELLSEANDDVADGDAREKF
jgi:chromosomal replication initiation ATPase DnaA